MNHSVGSDFFVGSEKASTLSTIPLDDSRTLAGWIWMCDMDIEFRASCYALAMSKTGTGDIYRPCSRIKSNSW